MSVRNSWRAQAHQLIDNYLVQPGAEPLTQTSLAAELGIARQTLWRDESIRVKLARLKQTEKAKGRKNKNARIEDLERKYRLAKYQNGMLIANLLLVCKRLRENGLDPREYVAEAATEIQAELPEWPAHRLLDEKYS
ncbi:hypothetical protein [Pseudomonas syringae]|uniref:hypothetical protein n=1 Tax=Pseudomonas syringae TaxID=317 RepID=UPI000CDB82A0|nr:hypothetical protein [Pseudomonas syringae]POP66877.1 hypothetical protein CXB35_21260 [Pseudomonas syringae]